MTAAHCNYGLPATTSGSTFEGVAVDKVWPFGAGPEVTSDPGNFNQDVMLIKLVSPITGVTPAHISTGWASIGQMVTDIGYGPIGNNCSTNVGKNYLEFALDTTNHVCDGDSGGPMFLGHLVDNGDLLAVNSSQNQPKEGYGDVVMFREDIASVMRLWDGGLEVGVNRGGQDFTHFATATAADCKTQCEQSYANCVAFTWVTSTGQCWLKNAIPAWSANSNCTSGVVQQATEKLEPGIGRPGGDFYNFAGTVNDCRNACAKDARCKAFTQVNGTCWMKAYVPAPISNSSATSGVRVAPEYHEYRSGAVMAEMDLDSQLPQACAAQCASTSGCVSYDWRRPLIALKAHCTLLSNNPAPTSARMEYATQDIARSFY